MADRRGMTLLEVLVALSILAISFVLLMRSHIQSYTMIARSDTMNRAALLGESVSARLTALGWGNASARYGYDEGPPRLFYQADIKSVPVPGFREIVIKISRTKGGSAVLVLRRWVLTP